MLTLCRILLVFGTLATLLFARPIINRDSDPAAIEARAVPNIKVAKTSASSSTTATNTLAVGNPKFTPIANPKANHGKWPPGIKVIPVWTVNGTTIWGVKPTHPGRPATWPPTGSPTTRSA